MEFGVVLAAVLLMAGCAGQAPKQPTDLDHCAIVAPMRVSHVLRKKTYYGADQGYIVPLDSAGKLDLDRPIKSDYAQEGQLYFLDLPPGRYAPVRFSFPAHGLRFSARLDNENSLGAVVSAGRGEVVFMGEFVLKRLWQGRGDWLTNGLRSVAGLLTPWRRQILPLKSAFVFNDRSPRMEGVALKAARRHLAGTAWVSAIDARLAALNLTPARPVEGSFFGRKHPVAQQETPLFSYVDTLEWGKPLPTGGGYEWRHPKGRARIHLGLVMGEQALARPLAAFLRTLKEQGSFEDTHALSEVVLSSAPAWSARYTTYHYPEPYLTGSVVSVSVTETLVTADPRGYFVLSYRSSREDFERFYLDFQRFRALLELKRVKLKREDDL